MPSIHKSIAYSSRLEVTPMTPNLTEIWESYKEVNKNRVAPTTIKHCWHEMDRYINLVPPHLLKTDKATEFINHLLSIYKPSSLAGIFRASLYPAASQAVKQGVLTRNVYRDVELPKTVKKKIECFEKFEIEAIIAAFYSDEYKSKKSGYLHSFRTSIAPIDDEVMNISINCSSKVAPPSKRRRKQGEGCDRHLKFLIEFEIVFSSKVKQDVTQT